MMTPEEKKRKKAADKAAWLAKGDFRTGAEKPKTSERERAHQRKYYWENRERILAKQRADREASLKVGLVNCITLLLQEEAQ